MAPTGSIGRSLELYYVDGSAEGLVTAKTFGWIGQVLLVPRTRMAEGLKRPETACAGVYFLLGERDGAPLAYIGESEAVGKRLLDHDSKKDWWTEVVCVTAGELNKAHVKYLEARLVEEARAVGAMPLDNTQTPLRNALSEADQGKMEAFLQTLMMVLPAVRLDMFVRRTRPAVPPSAPLQAVAGAEARFYLRSPKHGLSAEAVLDRRGLCGAGGLSGEGQLGGGSGGSRLRQALRRTPALRHDHARWRQGGIHCELRV